jgi:hypothetical protein
MVEAATGINLWREWANIETAMARNLEYTLPEVQNMYAGILISLTRQRYTDPMIFDDSEVCWRMDEEFHVGVIVKSESQERVKELLDKYAQVVFDGYHASAPVPDKPTN